MVHRVRPGSALLAGLCLALAACVPVAGGGAGGAAGGGGTAPAGEAAPPAVLGPERPPAVAAPPADPPATGGGAPGGTPPPVRSPDAGPAETAALERPAPAPCAATPGQEIVDAVNRVRREAGLSPVQVDARLVEAARVHTADMARRDRLGHTGSDGREVQHRAEAVGYDWLLIAENVASGQPTVADVMGSWMGSPGHRRNILSPGTRHMGAAMGTSAGGRPYWTQVFGNTEVRVPPRGGCHP